MDRRNQFNTGANEHIVTDNCLMLVCAIVITGNRARTDIHTGTDYCVADIGQMINLAAIGNRALLYFDEISFMVIVQVRSLVLPSLHHQLLTSKNVSLAKKFKIEVPQPFRIDLHSKLIFVSAA